MVTKKDLVEGEVYTITDYGFPNKRIIHQYERMYDPQRSSGYYIANYLNEDIFHFKKGTPYLDNRIIRESTYEEKQWLLECIKRGTFIPLEELKSNKIHELW